MIDVLDKILLGEVDTEMDTQEDTRRVQSS